MHQRIRMRAVIVLMLAIFTASCDQAAQITAPNAADAAYALNAKKLEQILGGLDGQATSSASMIATWQDGNVAGLTVGGFTHYLIVDEKAVRQETEFTMEVSSRTIYGREIRFIDLNATSVGSPTQNDVGATGFRPRSVVLCMDVAAADLTNPDPVSIFLLTDRSIVRQSKVSRPAAINGTTYTCASIPHFSGFVMGAN